MAPVASCPATPAIDWTEFKADYVTGDGRVLDIEAGGISHTEGQGWGMLLAEASGDREGFDRLWAWTQARLARPDVRLFAWKYDPAQPPDAQDRNNATDGDIFIAWALLKAARRWNAPAYAEASAEIRGAIASRLIVQAGGLSLLLPGLDGFAAADHVIYNPSYFVLPALNAFAAADPQGPWTGLIRDGLVWADRVRAGTDRLPPDWVSIGPDGALSPAPGKPFRFGFDAMRAPLYLVWGGAGRHPQVASARRFWAAHSRGDQRPPAWIDLVSGETAPYPLSPGGGAIAQLLINGASVAPQAPAGEKTYYSSVLFRLTALARSERGEPPR
jgi:endoglucanase